MIFQIPARLYIGQGNVIKPNNIVQNSHFLPLKNRDFVIKYTSCWGVGELYSKATILGIGKSPIYHVFWYLERG